MLQWNNRAAVQLGANVHATNDMGATPLHCAVKGAADADTVQALLRVGASPFALDNVRVTPADLAKVRFVIVADSQCTFHISDSQHP